MTNPIVGLYVIEIVSVAEYEIRNLPKFMWSEIMKTINSLAHDPYPTDATRLPFPKNGIRIERRGWYVLYEVDDNRRTVLIARVAEVI